MLGADRAARLRACDEAPAQGHRHPQGEQLSHDRRTLSRMRARCRARVSRRAPRRPARRCVDGASDPPSRAVRRARRDEFLWRHPVRHGERAVGQPRARGLHDGGRQPLLRAGAAWIGARHPGQGHREPHVDDRVRRDAAGLARRASPAAGALAGGRRDRHGRRSGARESRDADARHRRHDGLPRIRTRGGERAKLAALLSLVPKELKT